MNKMMRNLAGNRVLLSPLLALLLPLALSLSISGAAHAEKADSSKPTIIDADEGSGSNVTQNRTLTGNVVLVKGTLVMKSGRALVVEDPQGYQFVTFWADAGKLATFRQKRDGGPDLWMEGEAERIEYNNKDEIVKLFSKAKVTQLDGKRTTDQAQGPFISYDSRSEVFNLRNTSNGDSTPGGGRVRMVIESKEAAKPAKVEAKPEAKPATATGKP